jgi:hypothetical protein
MIREGANTHHASRISIRRVNADWYQANAWAVSPSGIELFVKDMELVHA